MEYVKSILASFPGRRRNDLARVQTVYDCNITV